MKKLITTLSLLIAMMSISAQTQWTVQGTHPVLHTDSSKWASLGQPTCIIVNDTFKMWYAAATTEFGDTLPRGRIYYAWSLDGYTWTKYGTLPVMDVGGPLTWDGKWLDTPEILKTPAGYNLYYYGDTTYFQGPQNSKIGLATSTDGINWTRHGPVLQKGNSQDFDGGWIESPAAFYDPASGLYALLYSGLGMMPSDTMMTGRLGLAVSMDGMHFMKYPGAVVNVEPPICWEDMYVAVPAVIKSGDIVEMWYCGLSRADLIYPDTLLDSAYVGYAVTIDGTTWLKYPHNPVLKPSSGLDSTKFWAIDVVFDSLANDYKMYFESDYIWGSQAIYLATSPRNILYSPNCNVTISNDASIFQGDSIPLLATGGSLYHWNPETGLTNPNIPNPIAFPDTTTTYVVLVMGDSCVITDTMTITVLPVSVNSIADLSSQIKVFPNPSEGKVEVRSLKFEVQKIEVYNMLGEKVFSTANNSKQINLDLSDLPNGFYTLIAIDDRGMRGTKKVVLSK